MDAQATLYALVGLWRLPLDVVIDPTLALMITVVLALIKNPKKQLRALACQDDLTGFIDVVTSPLTADEEAINSQYVAGTGGVSSHGNHMKLLKDLGGSDFGAGLETLWALFNYTADCPLDGSPEAYKEWVTSITDTFQSITGIGLYMSRQLARSCCLRYAPANLDLETLKSLDPDQGGHLDKFANVTPVPGIPPAHYAMVACLLKDVKPRRLVDCKKRLLDYQAAHFARYGVHASPATYKSLCNGPVAKLMNASVF